MKRSPYFVLISCVSAAALVILNGNVRKKENERSDIAHAQTLVATGDKKQEQLQKALKITSQFLVRDPLHAHALFVQGWAQQRLGHPREAIGNYTTLLEQITELGKFANYNKAILHEALGENELALQGFLGAVTLDPALDYSWIRAVNLLRRLGRNEEALATTEEAIGHNPHNGDLQRLRDELSPKVAH